MKALVTGGGGFIGANIVRRLLADGHEVVVLDNFSSGRRENLDGLNARLVEADVRDARAVDEAARGAEAIWHLAASVGHKRSLDFPVDDAEINVIGTLRVLEAARKAGARKVVFSSSAAVFGEPKTQPIREDHPCEPDSPYGASKLGAEKECLAYAKLFGIETICLRYFNVYGPLQRYDAHYGNVVALFVFKMLRGEPIRVFGDGEQTRDFVNVADVVQANLKAGAARGVSGAFNVGSGSRVSINELVRKLAAVSGLDPRASYGPPRPGDVRHNLADVSAARAVLGYAPVVGLEEGLRDFVAWARSIA